MYICRYHASQSDKDKEIHNKIADTLNKLQNPSKRDLSSVQTDSAFSDDDSSQSDSGKEESSFFDGSDSFDEDESDGHECKSDDDKYSNDEVMNDTSTIKWKDNLAQKAADAFVERQNSTANLWKLVYGK